MIEDRRRYRKIYIRLWKNPAYRILTDGEKLMALYLLSGPQTNRLGLFHLSFGLGVEDLRCSLKVFRTRVEKVCTVFSWRFDDAVNVIWIPSWWDFNDVRENAKVLQGALGDLYEVPETPLKEEFLAHLAFIPPGLHRLFTKLSVRHAIPIRASDLIAISGIQEQEQEQKQDQEGEHAPPVPTTTRTPTPSPTRTPTPIVVQSPHRNHALCGTVCLPAALFDDFVRRSRHEADPDSYVSQFFHTWETRYREGDRKTIAIGEDAFDFWRDRWTETHPKAVTVKTSTGPSALEILAEREQFRAGLKERPRT